MGDRHVVLLEHFGRNVFLGVNRLALAHPDEDHALERHGGELTGLHAWRADHHGLRPFGEERHAVAVTVEGSSVVRTGQEPFKIAPTHRQINGAVGAPVQQGLHFPLLVLEEHHVGTQHPQHVGPVFLHVLGGQGRVPVFPETQRWDAAAPVAGVVRSFERRGGIESLESAPHLLIAAGITGKRFEQKAFQSHNRCPRFKSWWISAILAECTGIAIRRGRTPKAP